MSATEVIESIKQLPPEEQKIVFAFVEDVKTHASPVRHMDPAKAKALSDDVFSEHAELFRKLAE